MKILKHYLGQTELQEGNVQLHFRLYSQVYHLIGNFLPVSSVNSKVLQSYVSGKLATLSRYNNCPPSKHVTVS